MKWATAYYGCGAYSPVIPMSVLTRLKRFLTQSEDESKPKCPGCGRPVGQAGAVCADCGSDQTRKPGG